MASYGELLHSISTASINQLLREYGFTQWAYFVNDDDGLSGVIFASETTLGLYTAADTDKLSLGAFGIVPIKDVYFIPDRHSLVLQHKGSEDYYSVVLFTDASRLGDDEQLAANFDYSLTMTWRQYLRQRGMRPAPPKATSRQTKVIIILIGLAILGALGFLLAFKPQ